MGWVCGFHSPTDLSSWLSGKATGSGITDEDFAPYVTAQHFEPPSNLSFPEKYTGIYDFEID